jgi:hypothetical protein
LIAPAPRDSNLANLSLTFICDSPPLLQRRHLESGYRSDQPEGLQNPNQHDHEYNNIQ